MSDINSYTIMCEHCGTECSIETSVEDKPLFCPFCSEENLDNQLQEFDDWDEDDEDWDDDDEELEFDELDFEDEDED